jgi:Protein of unknown function (DUF4230)
MLKTRLVNVVFYLAILAGLVLMFGFVLPRLSRLSLSPRISSTPVILQQVQTLSQLVTVKWVMEKVVICDDPATLSFLPLGESRVLLVAHAIVKAGINMSEIKEGDIQISKGKIILKLPPARVFDTYLDDKLTQVIDYKKGLLRSFNKDLEQNAREQAVLDINRAAREGGILMDADERARTQLTNLFHQLGFEEVQFRSP